VRRPADLELTGALRARARAAGLQHLDVRAVDTVIGSALDPEPLVVTGRRLLAARPEAVVRGLGAAALLGGARRLVLAVPDDLGRDGPAVRRAVAGTGVELVELPAAYPTDAAALACDLGGARPREGGPAPGVAVHDAAALVHLDGASRGVAATHAFVTIAGAVARPQVRAVPVGTSVAALGAAAGGAATPAWVALRGGALRGVLAERDDVVTAADDAVVVLPHDHPLVAARRLPLGDQVRRALAACEACGTCTAHCPPALLGHRIAPHEIVRAVSYLRDDLTPALEAATRCFGCGVCEIVCPTGLSPRALYAGVRAELARRRVAPGEGAPPAAAHPDRPGRRLAFARVVTRLGLGAYVPQPPWAPGALAVPRVTIPVGAAALAVARGDRVAVGDPLARAADGTVVPASITGVVEAVADGQVVIRAG
jgi:Na+-translocating ferredoxin:NAD+ oxidoreductase RnfC subunit